MGPQPHRRLPANDQALAGITTEEFVAALNVLRRIIDNLGGNSDIP